MSDKPVSTETAETNNDTKTNAQGAASTTQPEEQDTWKNGEKFDAEKAQALIEKLRSEAKGKKDLEKKVAAFEKAEQDRKDAELSELEKANKRIAELETKTKAAERREMQRQAAEKHKLPAALAERLKGETAEEIEADAEELFKTLPKTQQQGSPTNPPSGGVVKTDQQMREFLRGGPLPK